MGFQLWLKCGIGLCVADGKADYSKSQDHDRRKISGLRGAVWGNFYEGEQEQCHSVPAGALCVGLRISQWRKLCW